MDGKKVLSSMEYSRYPRSVRLRSRAPVLVACPHWVIRFEC